MLFFVACGSETGDRKPSVVSQQPILHILHLGYNLDMYVFSSYFSKIQHTAATLSLSVYGYIYTWMQFVTHDNVF